MYTLPTIVLLYVVLLDVKMSDAKKRKKSYYCQAKRQCGGRQMLDVGLKGFLITCNRMEKQTVREAYNLLNEYSSKLCGEVLLSYCHSRERPMYVSNHRNLGMDAHMMI